LAVAEAGGDGAHRGSHKTHHLEDAVGALLVKLSDEEVKTLEEPYIPHPFVGFE
jgi:hypothetical protein